MFLTIRFSSCIVICIDFLFFVASFFPKTYSLPPANKGIREYTHTYIDIHKFHVLNECMHMDVAVKTASKYDQILDLLISAELNAQCLFQHSGGISFGILEFEKYFFDIDQK